MPTAKQLNDLRLSLLEEGEKMMRDGRAKIDAAKSLEAVIRTLDAAFDLGPSVKASPKVEFPPLLPSSEKEKRIGYGIWTGIVERALKSEGVSDMDHLLKFAKTSDHAAGLSDRQLRERLRSAAWSLVKQGKAMEANGLFGWDDQREQKNKQKENQ